MQTKVTSKKIYYLPTAFKKTTSFKKSTAGFLKNKTEPFLRNVKSRKTFPKNCVLKKYRKIRVHNTIINTISYCSTQNCPIGECLKCPMTSQCTLYYV